MKGTEKERYFIISDDRKVEVSKEIYEFDVQDKRNQRNQSRKDRYNRCVHYSNFDTDETSGEDMIFDSKEIGTEEQAKQLTIQRFRMKRHTQQTFDSPDMHSPPIKHPGQRNSNVDRPNHNQEYRYSLPQQHTSFSTSTTPDIKPETTSAQPEPETKKLKTVDRQTGTIKQKNQAELKHRIGGLKPEHSSYETTKGIKNTGYTEKNIMQFHAQMTPNVGQAASTGGRAAKAGAGATTGGLMVAVDVIKKGKEKLQDMTERQIQEQNDQKQAGQKLGCFGVAICVLFIPFFLIFFSLLSGNGFSSGTNKNLSPEVLAYMPLIQEACQRHEIPEYAFIVAAIMMQESGGRSDITNGDVMQAAESQGWPAGTPIKPALSIDYGVQYFKACLSLAEMPPPGDIAGISLPIQGFNFGVGYITWAKNKYGGYTKENAVEFSNIWALKMGWSSYGDTDYVDHVLRYYEPGGGFGAIGDGLIAYPMPGHSWTTYAGHSGIDINDGGVDGKPIMAAASGKVTYAENGWTPTNGTSGMASYGNVVFIDHEGTPYQTRYGHMSYCIVSVGEYVQQGQVIGYVGSTGNSSGPHLHFEIVMSGNRMDTDGRCFAEHSFPQYKE